MVRFWPSENVFVVKRNCLKLEFRKTGSARSQKHASQSVRAVVYLLFLLRYWTERGWNVDRRVTAYSPISRRESWHLHGRNTQTGRWKEDRYIFTAVTLEQAWRASAGGERIKTQQYDSAALRREVSGHQHSFTTLQFLLWWFQCSFQKQKKTKTPTKKPKTLQSTISAHFLKPSIAF